MADDKKKKTDTQVVNITSNYQQGGITAHTVNIGVKPQRHLDEETKRVLLSKRGDIETAAVIYTKGDDEVLIYANEIIGYLTDSGFQVTIHAADTAYRMPTEFWVQTVYGQTVKIGPS